MKTVSQRLESRMHRMVRQRVRSCTQPATVWNIIESEMHTFLTDVLEKKLQEEQDALLQRRPYERGGDGRKRNGYKPLRLRGLFRPIILRRPVLRSKTPASPIVSLFKTFGQGIVALLASRFWLRGTATRAVAEELNQIMGTKLSSADVSQFSQALLPDIQAWLDRPISAEIAYLYLDALYLPVRKREVIGRQALLCAIGMTAQGQRTVLGFLLGDRETVDSWTALLKELLNEGLCPATLKLVISDEHKAIIGAVQQTLGVSHQLCLIHKMRNALCRVHSKHRKEFYADFTAAFWAPSREEALRALGRLEARWQTAYPKATTIACNNADAFLRFMDQPPHLWTILRSTNLIERFNREIRRRLDAAGTMQTDDELWKLLGALSMAQEQRWAKRSIRTVKELRLAA